MTKELELENRLAELEEKLHIQSQALSPAGQPRRKLHYSRTLISILILATLLPGSFFMWKQLSQTHSPFPDTVKNVAFPLYYPSELPAGFTLNKQSFERTNDVVTYTISYDSGKKMIFSIQPKPSGFNFEGFQSKGKRLESSIGPAYAGALDSQTVISLASGKSWLLISVPNELKTNQLQQILNKLVTVQPKS